MKTSKRLPGLAAVFGIWLLLAVCCWFRPSEEISMSERRKLAQFPEITAQSLFSGKFAEDFQAYSMDQFPFREHFRMLKASVGGLFGQKDNHGIYLADGTAAKIEYPLDRDSVQSAAEKLTDLYTEYIEGKTDSIYLSVIPDKGYYLAAKKGYPALDYGELFGIMREKMDYAEYLDLCGWLDAESYYRTDTHWRQEKLTGAAEFLAESMGKKLSGTYEEEVVRKDFRGVYYGQSALPMAGEEIVILRNPVIDSCRLTRTDTEAVTGVYDREALFGRDPYEVYLSGAAPVLTISNPLCPDGQKLIIFGDSFSSSLAPLLAEGWSEVTLVDIRYIDSRLIGKYVEFENADVFFLYSTLLLNDSGAMR